MSREVSPGELFGELNKAVLRYVAAEEKLAAIEALVAKVEQQPDRRPRDKYGPIGRPAAPKVLASSLRAILDGAS